MGYCHPTMKLEILILAIILPMDSGMTIHHRPFQKSMHFITLSANLILEVIIIIFIYIYIRTYICIHIYIYIHIILYNVISFDKGVTIVNLWAWVFFFRSSWTIPKFFPRSQGRLTLRAILDCLQAPQIAKDILSRKKSCYLGYLDPEPQKFPQKLG